MGGGGLVDIIIMMYINILSIIFYKLIIYNTFYIHGGSKHKSL